MISEKFHCPKCNSLQAFAKKSRTFGGMVENYGACNQCKHEIVYNQYPADQALIRERAERRGRAVRRVNKRRGR